MNSSKDLLLETLDQLIDARLDDPSFSIDSIAQLLGVSRSQLYRTIKDETDLSPSRYLRTRRLWKARELLLTTDLRISEVCDRVGFTRPQNLSTYFLEEFGRSPTEFRKEIEAARTEPAPMAEPTAEVETGPEPEASPAAAQSEVVSPKPVVAVERPLRWYRQSRWRLFMGAARAVLLLGVLGVYWFRPPAQNPLPTLGNNSLAILPLTNLGGADGGPACEGVLNEMHASIALLKNLKVIARSSSDQYQKTSKNMWQIGDELNVAYLLKGSVLKTGDQLQVKLELISTQEDIRVWEQVYRGAYQTIFSMTDQMVRDATKQLNLAIGSPTLPSTDRIGPEGGSRHPARTRNLEAYNLFLQGRQLVVGRGKDNLLQSLTRFDQALALDSTFADAYAYKATAYMLMWVLNYADVKATYGPAEQTALTALRLDPFNSTAYGALGSLYHNNYEWKAADNALRIGLQHNPNDAQLNYWYSLLLRSVGRLPEAVRYSQRAIELDPLYPVMLTGHVLNCVYLGDKAKARAGLQSGRGIFDNAFIYYLAKGYYHLDEADYGQAIASFNTLLRLNPNYKNYESAVFYCRAKQGKRAEALAWLQKLPTTVPRADYDRAVVFAGLNESDSCLHYLKKAADAGFYHRDMKVITWFKPYRNHPTFRAILRQYKVD